MLARHLNRLARPVRYALSTQPMPALLSAIQAYLRVHVPHLGQTMRDATRYPRGESDLVHSPLFQQTIQSLHQTGHPGDLHAAVDQLTDAGIPAFRDDLYEGPYLPLIHGDLRALLPHVDQSLNNPVPSGILRAYGPQSLDSPGVRDRLMQWMRGVPPPRLAYGWRGTDRGMGRGPSWTHEQLLNNWVQNLHAVRHPLHPQAQDVIGALLSTGHLRHLLDAYHLADTMYHNASNIDPVEEHRRYNEIRQIPGHEYDTHPDSVQGIPHHALKQLLGPVRRHLDRVGQLRDLSNQIPERPWQ